MSVQAIKVQFDSLEMHTRMPFRYGMTELRSLPHLIVRMSAEIDGKTESGVSADGLAPKWFTKNPATSVAHDLEEMREIIRLAARLAVDVGPHPTVFDWWQALYAAQRTSAPSGTPPLLWNFGVSLMERAMIHAFCRRRNTTFAPAIQANAFGIRLGEIHSRLAGRQPGDLLPPAPRRQMIVRHTVGLSDPLTDAEIAPGDKLNDGLPQSLTSNIDSYGLTHFKIKLGGNAEADRHRLKTISDILTSHAGDSYLFTLDGNEQYKSLAAFRPFWESLLTDMAFAPFLKHLLFVEQPIVRDHALTDETQNAMLSWHERPPMIIDESDGELSSLPRALECGYIGTSHKNCKGIFKGIANACLIHQLRNDQPDHGYILSGEDLANVGPVALLQDLAVASCLGLQHVERNGHHYFAGLSAWPKHIQEQTMAYHGDLYRRSPGNEVQIDIRSGRVQIGSMLDAPFGIAFIPERAFA